MKINDLIQRYDGLLGIVTRVRKSGIVRVMIFDPMWEIDQIKKDWKVVSERRSANKNRKS